MKAPSKTQSLVNLEQRMKFEQAARDLEADDSETKFDQVLRKVARVKPGPKVAPKKKPGK